MAGNNTRDHGQLPKDARDAASYHLGQGHRPIPFYHRAKVPIGEGWQNQRPTAEDLDRLFPDAEARNIGLLLGEPSQGLVDVDLDSEEAIRAAPYLLPSTQMVSGRTSRPHSHFWYRVNDPPAKAEDKYGDIDR